MNAVGIDVSKKKVLLQYSFHKESLWHHHMMCITSTTHCSKAEEIQAFAREIVSEVTADESFRLTITQNVTTLNALVENETNCRNASEIQNSHK